MHNVLHCASACLAVAGQEKITNTLGAAYLKLVVDLADLDTAVALMESNLDLALRSSLNAIQFLMC